MAGQHGVGSKGRQQAEGAGWAAGCHAAELTRVNLSWCCGGSRSALALALLHHGVLNDKAWSPPAAARHAPTATNIYIFFLQLPLIVAVWGF